MTYESLEHVIADPLFVRADLDLRRGRHIGADYDSPLFDFLTYAKPFLETFYERYDTRLVLREEAYFYLLPDRNAIPPPLGQRRLSALEMLVGQALALMRIDPKWLEESRCIPETAVLELLQQILGEEKLLQFAQRRRGKGVDRDARKFREAFTASLRTLERQGFVRRGGKGDAAIVKPLDAIMRFADPVRASGELDAALENLIAHGHIAEGGDDPDAEPES